MTSKIDELLLNLQSEENTNKDTIIDELSDLIKVNEISVGVKNEIVTTILSLFNPEINYCLQESIFYFIAIAIDYNIMTKKITDFILEHISTLNPILIEYALEAIINSDLSDKKEIIQECLNSSDPLVLEVIFGILRIYRQDEISC